MFNFTVATGVNWCARSPTADDEGVRYCVSCRRSVHGRNVHMVCACVLVICLAILLNALQFNTFMKKKLVQLFFLQRMDYRLGS